MIKLEDLCISYDAILRDALIKMDSNAKGLLFVVIDRKLLGVVTDGDVRRAIISGKTINDSIEDVYNSDCFFLPQDAKVEDIQANINERVKIIPLVDSEGNIVDFSSLERLHRIPVLEPLLGGNELEYVTECIKTNWISSQGKYVKLFEEEVAKYTNSKYVLAVSNGTVALHLALVSLGIGPGDEVLVPDITFGATLNAILLTGAKPVLLDVDQDTWNISVQLIENNITDRTRAIMPVHIYGVPCDMPSIMNLANKYNLFVIEDCAEALGSNIDGTHVGTFGDSGTFSFFGNKVITCGEGGAIIFRDEKVYEKAKVLRDHGMRAGKRYWHDEVGFNYRLTNLQAAVGCAQFEQLESFREQRKRIFHWYDKYLLSSDFFKAQKIHAGYESSLWLYTVQLKDSSLIERDDLIDKLAVLGIDTRPVFFPMSKMPAFLECKTSLFGYSDIISKRGISLPTSVYLNEEDIEYISKEIISIIENNIALKEPVLDSNEK
ncbi:hypothetical protein AMR76_21810 [Vibrio furnissii]|uniref:GDP-perosamine synthase n=1 Tax=Vibrio furnissii TaxID=29494 RepID=A0A0Q2USV1_VIBFU|nr:aminotransferase class I/II-fold pyridoxal phosphate-dependent enzyme [Vibrio furnissii]KQH83648.1 hypothetical protein AMR76_21810 [Vibrio furnissii]